MKKELVIISPKWPEEVFNETETCNILLIPDSATEILGHFNADCVVSYGMGDKSTITLSSISDNEIVVTLQREVPTIQGEILERQEIKLRRPSDITEESILAIAGTMLIAGVLPEKLSDFF